MSADHSAVPTSTPTTTMAAIPQALVIRTRDEPNGNNSISSKKKKHPVIVHTKSVQPSEMDNNNSNNNGETKMIVAADRFTTQYGSNFTGLEPWVRLCRDLGVQGPLNSKTQCKKALAHIHVNIRDFLDGIDIRAFAAASLPDPVMRAAILNTPVCVRFFDSEWSLSAYTLASHRVYPRHEIRANQEHPLRLLMAHIRYPRGGKARRGAIGC